MEESGGRTKSLQLASQDLANWLRHFPTHYPTAIEKELVISPGNRTILNCFPSVGCHVQTPGLLLRILRKSFLFQTSHLHLSLIMGSGQARFE